MSKLRARETVDHGAKVSALSFTWAGDKLVSGAADGTLRCWELGVSRGPIASFRAPGNVIDIACLPGGDSAWITSYDEKKVQHWDVARGTLIKAFGAHSQWPRVTLSGDGAVAITIGRDSSIPIVWDVATKKKRGQLKGHKFGLDAWQPSHDGKRLATIGWYDSTLRCWDTTKLKQLWKVDAKGLGRIVAWSPDGTKLAIAGNRAVTMHQATKGAQELWRVDVNDGPYVRGLAWSSDGTSLTGCWATLMTFDAASGASIDAVTTKEASAMATSRDGKIAVATGNGEISIFEPAR